MVILPLYQAVYATAAANFTQTDYFALMKDGRVRAMDMALGFPSYSPERRQICGISVKGEKDYVGRCALKMTEEPPELVFTLSNSRILYPAASPDNQKIAFIEQEIGEEKGTLRIIQREEFGWFPVQIRFPASLSPVAWGSGDTILFTGEDGALYVTPLDRRGRPVKVDDAGLMPASHAGTKRLAFVQGREIVFLGDIRIRIEAGDVSALSFSNDGASLLFAVTDNGHYQARRVALESREISPVCEASARIVMVSEI